MTTATARRNKRLRHHAERIRDEGQGVWQIAIYSDFASVVAAAAAGERRAQQVLAITHQLAGRIVDSPANYPMLCLTCDAAFGHDIVPQAVVLVHAWRDDPDHALVHGLCPACCRRWNQSEREIVVTDTLRRLLINDLKRVEINDPPGHA